MRFDPRRPQPDANELLRSRDEMARLQAEKARQTAIAQHTNTPTNTPAYGRSHAVRMPVARTTRPSQSNRQRVVVTIALVVIAFLSGFWYANALSDGAAIRQLRVTDGMLPWS